MTLTSSSSQPGIAGLPRVRRWVALGIASILLHLTLLDWADENIIGMPAPHDQSQTMVTATMLAAPRAAPVAALKKPARKKPKPRPRPAAPARLASITPPPIQQETVAEAVEIDSAPAESGVEATDTSTEPSTVLADVAEDKPADPAAVRYTIDPPPSAELKYDVHALIGEQTFYGSGKIGWQFDGSNYAINGEASLLFFTLLNFKSEGTIDAFGVAPVIYSEKRPRKSETNTHFQRERNIISFSASTASYPRNGGEQDRASIIWQLVGIGRGSPDQFKQDTGIAIFVAGARDGEIWNFHIIGEEEIETTTGKFNAWHVARMPRPGSYDEKIDLWLAPQQQWYPVKVRYTERNGNYTDLSLSKISSALSAEN